MSPLDIVIRMVVAALAGAILGWERQAQHKPAGLKTHMLVSLGAATFLVSALHFFHQQMSRTNAPEVDLLKVIAGLAGGVGFLGAGAVIQSRGSVRGLTTAATIWLSAAVGVASGLGYYVIVGTCLAVALSILLVIGAWEEKAYFKPAAAEQHQNLEASDSSGASQSK